MNKESVKGLLLEDLWQLCYAAHSNTSFSPEKRATMYVTLYSEILKEDLEKLGDNPGNYKEKFIAKFSDWMSAKSRCISSMITGPSNFPVRRAEKANNSEHNKSEAFTHWRTKYFEAVNRVPTLSPEDDLEIAYRKLDNAIVLNENIKEYNKVIRQYKKEKISRESMMNQLIALEISAKTLESIDKHIDEKWFINIGTMGTTIRKLKERATILTNRIERKLDWEDILFKGGRVTIEDDRVKIFHDNKPESEIINELKKNGFRWSPNWKAWVRKHTGNSIWATKRLSFITKKEE